MKEFRQLQRGDFDHELMIETRWGDMDALGHLNHVNYLTYMETARVEYYSSLGFGPIRANQNPSLILGGMMIDYISQIHHPARLVTCHRIESVGKKSFEFLGGIFQLDEQYPSFTGLFKMICFDYITQQTIEVPQIIRDRCWNVD